MPSYEVKAWVSVEAEDEDDAIYRASCLLDTLPDESRGHVSIEGEGAVYEEEGDDEAPAAETKEYSEKDVVSVHITWNRKINGKRGKVIKRLGRDRYAVKLTAPPSALFGPPDGIVYLYAHEMEPW